MIYIIIKLISNIIVNIGFFFLHLDPYACFRFPILIRLILLPLARLLMACLLQSGRLLFDKEYIFICNASVCVYIL